MKDVVGLDREVKSILENGTAESLHMSSPGLLHHEPSHESYLVVGVSIS